MRKTIDFPIGFNDSELVSYERTGQTLSIALALWNGKRIKIHFSQFEAMADKGMGDVSGFVEELEQTSFYTSVIPLIFPQGANDNPCRLYHFLDLDEEVVMEVVASEVNIELMS